MRACSQVVLSYLDAGFEPRCRHKDFWVGRTLDRPLQLAAYSSTLTGKHPFFTPNGPWEDTAVRKTLSSSPIRNGLIVQSLWTSNIVVRNRLLDKRTIVLSFQDDRL